MIIPAETPHYQVKQLDLQSPFDGINLSYIDWGHGRSERVALCVHGLTRNSRDFDFLARHLVENGYRVIAVDIVGRGNSSWLTEPANYTVPIYVAHMTQFVQRLSLEQIDWIGTSMGGIIGMVLAAAEGPCIDRLVLNDVGPFISAAALQEIQSYLGLDLRFGSLQELEDHLRQIHASFGALPDEQWRHMAAHSSCETEDGWVLNYDPKIRTPFDASDDIDLWPVWDAIRCPVLVLHGADSRLLNDKTCLELEARGPDSTVVHIPNTGHAPALMDASQHTIISRWLNSA